MTKTKLFLLALILITTAPFAVSADAVSELRAELQTVLSRIAALKSELTLIENGITPTIGGGSACVTISKNLAKKSENAEVLKLQLFLAQDKAIYPEGITSGYFGTLTERAVQRWQRRNGIASYGTPSTTGYGAVGPKTRNAIAAACNGSSNIAGVDKVVSFAFQKNVGQAPFASHINLTMLDGACMSYKVNWGDGSPETTHASNQSTDCGGGITTVPLMHTYSLEGNYPVTLFAGKGRITELPQVTATNIAITTGAPYLKMLTPNGGETLRLGDNVTMKWQVANQPQDSAVVFYMVGPSGTYRFAKRSHRSQEFDWIVGDRVCDGNGCNVQLPIGAGYKVRAVMYTPADACIDFCSPESITPQFLVNDESDAMFSLGQLGNDGTSPLTLLQQSGKAPFSATLTAKISPVHNGAGNFEVDFGDGSTPYRIHIPAGEARTTLRTLTHTYATIGDYYARLRPVGAVQHIAQERITVTEPEFKVMPKTLAHAPVKVKAIFNTDTSCVHTAGAEDIVRTYTLDWGDNSETSRFELRAPQCGTIGEGSQSFSPQSFMHDYLEPGSYNPELSIRVGNAQYRKVTNVSVSDTTMSLSPTFGFKPLATKVRFTADESCVMGNPTDINYSIDWGDGTAKTEYSKGLVACGQSFSLSRVDKEFSHTYQEIGRYTVTLTTRKGNIGSSSSRTAEVVVDKSVLRNGARRFAQIFNTSNLSESMASAVQAVFK